MQTLVKVIDIGMERDTKAGKVVDLKVVNNSNQELKVGCFINKDKLSVKTGDEVMMEIKSKEYNGRTYYSTSVAGISIVESVNSPQNPKEAPKEHVSDSLKAFRESYAKDIMIACIQLAKDKMILAKADIDPYDIAVEGYNKVSRAWKGEDDGIPF